MAGLAIFNIACNNTLAPAVTGHFELKEYEALGGLEGSIRNAADDALSPCDLQENQLAALHAAFVPALVRVGPDGARVKRQAYRDELPRDAAKLLQRFVEARLLVTHRDRDGRETIELAHEALLRVWPRLDVWLAQDQDKLHRLESVLAAAEEWQRGDRSPDLLVHRNDRLADAMVLVREPRFSLKAVTTASAYLSNCEAAQKLSDDKAKEARQAARQALVSQSRYLANRSREFLDEGQMETAVLLALEALPKDIKDRENRPYTAEAEAVLYKALAAPIGLRKIKSLSGDGRAFAR